MREKLIKADEVDMHCDNIFCSGCGKGRQCFWFENPATDCKDHTKDKDYGIEPGNIVRKSVK